MSRTGETDTVIDLRSDTLTRPTPAMREAMAWAEVGDDVFGEDPTVRALEERVAELFGHEAALFCPSGSMANVLAVAAVVRPGQEVLCHAQAHIARAELGAHAALSGLTMRTWQAGPGELGLPAIRELYAPDLGPYFVPTAAVAVENTHNFTGGAVLDLAELRALRAWADEVGCAIHLDGARIWNAHVATGVPLVEYGRIADVMAVCLSKGLGAPVGSLALGSADAVAAMRVQRKRLGGAMRQAGILAAAGLYALDHHLDRLAEDHRHARLLAQACGVDPAGVDSNIVLIPHPEAARIEAEAAARGVRMVRTGPTTLRLVTHLDVDTAQAEQAAAILADVLGG